MSLSSTRARQVALGVVAAALLAVFLVTDVGGGPLRSAQRTPPARPDFEIRSAGPDGRWGTGDDLLYAGEIAK
jgi:hypothetical protein